MDTIRASLKFILFLINTILFYSMIMLVLLASLLGLNYERLRAYFLNLWGRSSCRIIGLQMNIIGKAPEPPFFLVSNHLSYLDVFVLFSQVKGLFVAKSDVKNWPLIGFITRTCGILFIDRERKRDVTRVNRLIGENINENQGIIMFPESKTSPGIHILPFRSSLLEYPATSKLPVTYAIISYSSPEGEEVACKTACWWADEPFIFHFFNLLKKQKIKATITFGEEKIVKPDRKELAKVLEYQIKSDFKPIMEPQRFEELFGSLEKGRMFAEQNKKFRKIQNLQNNA